MGFFTIFATMALAASAALASSECTPEMRVHYSKLVGLAYNAPALGESEAIFNRVPWGEPDQSGTCYVTIIPDGSGCSIPVATTGKSTVAFAVETRQVFYHLQNTAVIPFDNGTVLYSVEIQLGIRDIVPLPVTFHGYVYMDFNEDCRIYSARAYADIPDSLLGQMLEYVSLPDTPECQALLVGGTKKRSALPLKA